MVQNIFFIFSILPIFFTGIAYALTGSWWCLKGFYKQLCETSSLKSLSERGNAVFTNTAQIQPMKKEGKNLFFVLLAAVIMAFNISNFARAGGLLPGGFTGISLLLQKIGLTFFQISIPYSIINIPLNALPALISFRQLGRKFTINSVIMILATSLLVDIIPNFSITDDLVLCTLFGGILNGVAISICLLSNATSGGTDFISIFISKRYGIDAWNYIFAGNVIVLSLSGFLYGWHGAMYSIILQFVSTTTIQNFYKHYQKETLLIITKKPEKVYEQIKYCTNHDGTLFKGTGMYQGKERNLIYSVVSSDELSQVISHIREVDADAFINIMKSVQVKGNFYQKPMD